MTPVIRPPVRKLIFEGHTFEKSYDGLTTFAAMFVDSVATASVNVASRMMNALSNFDVSWTGSQIASP